MTTHYFQYLEEQKTSFEAGPKKFGLAEGHWRAWFDNPVDTTKYEAIPFSGPLHHSQFKLAVAGKLSAYAPHMWTYGFNAEQEEALENAFSRALKLCRRAANALRDGVDDGMQQLLDSYFRDTDYKKDEATNIGILTGQFESVSLALETKATIFVPGNPAKSGRDAIAYVDTRDDALALRQTSFNDALFGNYGMIHINSSFFKPATATKADDKWKNGATVLHELTHLFSTARTDDKEIANNVSGLLLKEYGVDKQLQHCYGRAACKALGAKYHRRSFENADSLALLAVDVSLLKQKTSMSIQDVLNLT